MNKIEYALRLAKDCTYADEMMESAKEHLRKKIDEALTELKNNVDLDGVSQRSELCCPNPDCKSRNIKHKETYDYCEDCRRMFNRQYSG